MDKKIALLVIICFVSILPACRLKENPNHAKEELISMEGYAAEVKISNINGDQVSTYEAKQVYQMDGRYRFEVIRPEHIEGLTTIYNGEKVIQYNPKVEPPSLIELPENNFRNQVFLGSFVKNYLQSEAVAIEVQKIQGDHATVLEAIIPGGSKQMSRQRLWLDQNTSKPLKMVIYSSDQKERVKIEFLEFIYNPKINEKIFTID